MTAKKMFPMMRGPHLPSRDRVILAYARELVRGGVKVKTAVRKAFDRYVPPLTPSEISNPGILVDAYQSPDGAVQERHIDRLYKAYFSNKKHSGKDYAVRGYWHLNPKWLNEPAEDDVKN
jgi:hypothetical protein